MNVIRLPKSIMRWGYGLTLYKLVLIRKNDNEAETIAHEAEHVRQWVEIGFFTFPCRYLYFLYLYGYKNNPYEVQARKSSIRDLNKYIEYK